MFRKILFDRKIVATGGKKTLVVVGWLGVCEEEREGRGEKRDGEVEGTKKK